MLQYLYKRILALVMVLAATFIVAPLILAFQPPSPAPQVGTVPIFDGGKRAQWRGYLYKNDSWWKKSQRFQRTPNADLLFRNQFFQTEPQQ